MRSPGSGGAMAYMERVHNGLCAVCAFAHFVIFLRRKTRSVTNDNNGKKSIQRLTNVCCHTYFPLLCGYK